MTFHTASTHCGQFPHDTGWTAVDPKRPWALLPEAV